MMAREHFLRECGVGVMPNGEKQRDRLSRRNKEYADMANIRSLVIAAYEQGVNDTLKEAKDAYMEWFFRNYDYVPENEIGERVNKYIHEMEEIGD